MSVGTVQMMPGDKHLFVSAGAGYIIDLKTRTLVEQMCRPVRVSRTIHYESAC